MPTSTNSSGMLSQNSSTSRSVQQQHVKAQQQQQQQHFVTGAALLSSNAAPAQGQPSNNSKNGATGRFPPPAHGGPLKRESPSPLISVDHRSLTPDSRGTPVAAAGVWRPPSLSPKLHSGHNSSRFSPMEVAKSFDGRTSAPPVAHQSSSPSPLSRPNRLSSTPNSMPAMASTSTSHNVQSDQPENLVVKADKGHRPSSRSSENSNGSMSNSRTGSNHVISYSSARNLAMPQANGPLSQATVAAINGHHQQHQLANSVPHSPSLSRPNSSTSSSSVSSVKPTFLSVANLISSSSSSSSPLSSSSSSPHGSHAHTHPVQHHPVHHQHQTNNVSRSNSPANLGLSSSNVRRPQAAMFHHQSTPPPSSSSLSATTMGSFSEHMTVSGAPIRAHPGHITHTPSPPAAHSVMRSGAVAGPDQQQQQQLTHQPFSASLDKNSSSKRKQFQSSQSYENDQIKRQREEEMNRQQQQQYKRNLYSQPLPPPPGIYFSAPHPLPVTSSSSDLNRLASDTVLASSRSTSSTTSLLPGAPLPPHSRSSQQPLPLQPPSGSFTTLPSTTTASSSSSLSSSLRAPVVNHNQKQQQHVVSASNLITPSLGIPSSLASSLAIEQRTAVHHHNLLSSPLAYNHHSSQPVLKVASSNLANNNLPNTLHVNSVNNSQQQHFNQGKKQHQNVIHMTSRPDGVQNCDSYEMGNQAPFAYKHPNAKATSLPNTVISSGASNSVSDSGVTNCCDSSQPLRLTAPTRKSESVIELSLKSSLSSSSPIQTATTSVKSEFSVNNVPEKAISDRNSPSANSSSSSSSLSSVVSGSVSAAPNFKKKWLQNYSGDTNVYDKPMTPGLVTTASSAMHNNKPSDLASLNVINDGSTASQLPSDLDKSLIIKKEEPITPTSTVNGSSFPSFQVSSDKKLVRVKNEAKSDEGSRTEKTNGQVDCNEDSTENSDSDEADQNENKSSPLKQSSQHASNLKSGKKEAKKNKRPNSATREASKKYKKLKREPDDNEDESPSVAASTANSSTKDKESKLKKKKKDKKDRLTKKYANDEDDETGSIDHSPKSPKGRVGNKRGRKPKDNKEKSNSSNSSSSIAAAVGGGGKSGSGGNNNNTASSGNVDKMRDKADTSPVKLVVSDLTGKKVDKIKKLKESGARFLQFAKCSEIAPKLVKCRECEQAASMRKKKNRSTADSDAEAADMGIFCRFYEFRKLYYGKNGVIYSEGFSEPTDATARDMQLWQVPDEPLEDLNQEDASFMLQHVGHHFCEIVRQEREAKQLHIGNTKVAWKKMVAGVREMCDVCETTLFNIHWVCEKCGFVVCIDCYKSRKEKEFGKDEAEEDSEAEHSDTESIDGDKKLDKFKWLLCAKDKPHKQKDLVLTQIIAGNALDDVYSKLHQIKGIYDIISQCKCLSEPVSSQLDQKEKSLECQPNGLSPSVANHNAKNVLSSKLLKENNPNGVSDTKDVNQIKKDNLVKNAANGDALSTSEPAVNSSNSSPLSMLAEVALGNSKENSNCSENNPKQMNDRDLDENQSQLRSLLEKPTPCDTDKSQNNNNVDCTPAPLGTVKSTEETSPADRADKKLNEQNGKDDCSNIKAEHEEEKEEKEDKSNTENAMLPVERKFDSMLLVERKERKIWTWEESSKRYPGINHSWFCSGRLLVLIDAVNLEELSLFQAQWSYNQPVMVTGIHSFLEPDLWIPSYFIKKFGESSTHQLVDCRTNNTRKMVVKRFWDGFENIAKRPKDKESGDTMILKLKDYPPGDDFHDELPEHFKDLQSVMPIFKYTTVGLQGIYNLARRLPETFVRPDLGPKLYVAYGPAMLTKGTTNLHLDVSDAMNIMCYVGMPKSTKESAKEEEASIRQQVWRMLEDGGVDGDQIKRCKEKKIGAARVGAIWHVYDACDADKMREFLKKIGKEEGRNASSQSMDPIHDQTWYLDAKLRDRLRKETGIEGYAIAQCLGDAIIIPAGAPHQVLNINSCIKVAGDFVSPENVAHCFNLTEEFRKLSDSHMNHQDKLQIKNIMYHAVKDALASFTIDKPVLNKVKSEKRNSNKIVNGDANGSLN
ncbi:Lysine-specific demethylase 3A [Halotydeus destructor]|nr:Lysine-specific demethylase 3A [Halotydeus destructor]